MSMTDDEIGELAALIEKAELRRVIADAHHTVDYAGREHGWLRCEGELVPLGAMVLRVEGMPQDVGRARLDLFAKAVNSLPTLVALIAAQQERLKLADEVIRPFAERRTVEEALREQGPSEWALAAPERRAELLGERKRAHDAAILAARSFTEGSLRDG